MQHGGRRQRVRRLHHRQRRQQSRRAHDVGRGCRSSRAGVQLLFLRRAEPGGRGAGLFHHRPDQADGSGGERRGLAARRLGRRICATPACGPPSASASASCSPSSARSPTSISCWCASRFRSGDVARPGLSCLPAVDRDDAAGGPRRPALGTRPHVWSCAGARRRRAAA